MLTTEPLADVIKTTGKIFLDGDMIDVVRDGENASSLKLVLYHGDKATMSKRIGYGGRIYEAAPIDSTILDAVTLPTRSAPYGSARQLLTEISGLVGQYSGLSEHYATTVSRLMLSTWFVDAITAPRISIIGPETLGGTQLFRLSHCFCRRPLMLTDVDAGGIYSLPMRWDFTLLIQQPEFSPRLQRLLNATRRRKEFVPRNGRLLDFHCAVATYSELSGYCSQHSLPGIEIPVSVNERRLSVLDNSAQQKISETFQPMLLTYRLANYKRVCTSTFDAQELTPPVWELARALGACVPGDTALQAETVELLRGQDAGIRSAKWTELNTVIIEAILGLVHEGKMECAYMGEIAEAAETILACRDAYRKLEGEEVGPRVRLLGFVTEPRNSRGIRLLFTHQACRRAHVLARDNDVPSVQNVKKDCQHCISTATSVDR